MKELLQKIGFSPKENTKGVFVKKYSNFDNYIIEVDFEKKLIDYGKKIKSESKATQNFSQKENCVVLECVNRLLEKGYKPEDLTLEKTWKTGHGTSGRLDILVKKNKKAYLMIECKTFGNEFKKEFQNLNKNGGQLFTYFQLDRSVEYLILYASQYEKNKIQYVNEIVKIEKSYRETSNVKDFYDRWSKLTTQNGLFDEWVNAYDFKSTAILNFIGEGGLKDISLEDSRIIFNQFLEILRHNVVSDKPNAFNKIFNLFLCKIIDEAKTLPNQPLKFQWFATPQIIEEINPATGTTEKKNYPADDNVTFQKRLTELYALGMKEFLKKEVQSFGEEKIRNLLGEKVNKEMADQLIYSMVSDFLKKNNEFAIKEVFDTDTFEENSIVVREIVDLLSCYRIRYPRKQQHLSDFFEKLLTTGLKQESGQFFTPVPIARFICKSIPLKKVVHEKLYKGETDNLIPNIIDYAAGSGHFLTESMEEVQKYIDNFDNESVFGPVKNSLNAYKTDKFGWAMDHIYGIEKDYRLVKVSKVGCYFYGDGLASVIHGDGLDCFKKSKRYRGFLKSFQENKISENRNFDFVLANPPYSVSGFLSDLRIGKTNAENNFELYKYLTDQSSEIECLFIERTKQLLKDGGIAGIILPSSMLSNTGIYTKTREIILKYFDIIGITELGSNTFMATGTNTVVLFLKRKNNYDWQNIKSSVDKFSTDLKDITVNKVENIFSKYVKYVWEEISFNDYISIFKKSPVDLILNNEIYKEYQKIKLAKNEKLIDKIIELEKDKLLYFILAYSQKVVLVKSGEKKIEKAFLGYEFSNRRGSEGIHPIQKGKLIDECTKLFDSQKLDNPTKASTYILDAFENNFEREIDEELKNHISRIDLVDMMIWDRNSFEKNISLNVKKKIKIESKYEQVHLEEIVKIKNGFAFKSSEYVENGLSVIRIKNVQKGQIVDKNPVYISSNRNTEFKDYALNNSDILISMTGNPGRVGIVKEKHLPALLNQRVGKLEIINDKILKEYLFNILNTDYFEESVIYLAKGLAQLNISASQIESIKIPLPPKNIQEKIVKEIEILEEKKSKSKDKIEELKKSIKQIVSNNAKEEKLDNIKIMLSRGKSPKYGSSSVQIIKSGQARGYKEFDFSEKYYISESFIIDERKLEKGDILINSSGVGTAGRVTLFNLDGNFVVDSHVSILRLDKTKANHDYVLYSLANIGFKTIEAMAMGQSGQIELSQTTIKNIKIPLPTIQEQNKIVKQIEKLETDISKLESQINEIPKLEEEVLKKYL